MRTLVLDFETYYDTEYSLSKMTTQDYITDPRFEVLMASYILDNGRCVVLDGHEVAPFLSALDPANTVVVNHNAAFDATILSVRYGFNPKMIVDTMSMARVVGAHIAAGGASLDALATCLRNQGFDLPAKGTVVQNAKGKRRKDFTDDEWAAYREYCKIDTVITHKLLKYLAPYLQDNPTELSFQDLIMKCMARPLLAIDKALVEEELAYVKGRREKLLQSLADTLNIPLTGLSTELRSNERMARLYEQYGGYAEHPHGVKAGSEKDREYVAKESGLPGAFPIPQKVSKTTGQWTWAFGKTDAPMLALLEHENPSVVGLTEVRLGTKSSIDETRCDRFMKLADAGFMCMPYLICGAHTGRMSGRDKVNVQNLPAGRAEGQTNNLRRSIIPRYNGQVCVVCDSSQIECVSGDGLVLTDSGLKRIDCISTSDLLWDGVEWIAHSGVIYKGNRNVIEYDGIVGTPDHIVFTTDGRKLSLDEAAATKATLLVGERGGEAVRQMDSVGFTDKFNHSESDVTCSLRLWVSNASKYIRLTLRKVFGVSKLYQQETLLCTYPAFTMHATATTIQRAYGTGKGKQKIIENIRQYREQVQILQRLCPVYVEKVPERRLSWLGNRSYRFPWSLRTGKCTFGDTERECTNESDKYVSVLQWGNIKCKWFCQKICSAFTFRYSSEVNTSRANHRSGGVLYQETHATSDKFSWCSVHGIRVLSHVFKRKSNRRPFSSVNQPKYSPWGNPIIGTIPVYDIVNAGPRSRFCYNGRIISNCRVSSYMANNTPDLEAFAAKQDIYTVMASNLYGEPYDVIRKGVKVDHNPKYMKQRQVAKAAVLSCQFGTGAKAFQAYAKVVGGVALTSLEAKAIVDGYRETNWRVVDAWKTVGWAMDEMIAGRSGYFGGPNNDLFYFDGSRHVFGAHVPGIRLPSGLWINYKGLGTEMGQWPDGSPKTEYFFYHGSGKRVEKKYTYNSKVYENLTQGLAFQVMAHQAVRIAARYPIVMNVHDEWVCVVPESEAQECLDYMIDCMRTPPNWIPGLPLDAEGDIAYRYGDAK